MSYQPRKYFCVNPIGPACRKGFVTARGFEQHKAAVHNNRLQPKSRAWQHTYRPSTEGAHSDSEDDTPNGAYYVQHPILDGKAYSQWS
jgi:hypothetical protein